MSNSAFAPWALARPRLDVRRRLILGTIVATVVMVAVDTNSLALALPSIASALQLTGSGMVWIADAYPLALAALLVTMGALADRFGRRRMLCFGAAGVAVFGVVSALAPSAGVLIASRACMGVFGAALMPATLSIIRSLYRAGRERGLAMAGWSAAGAGGAVVGPLLGGAAQSAFGWRAALVLSLPLAIVVLVAAPLCVPETRADEPAPVDPASVALSATAMVALVWGLLRSAESGLDLTSIAALAGGLLAGTAFVRRQLRLAHPMLDMRLFRLRGFSMPLIVNATSSFAMTGFVFYSSQQVQIGLGEDVETASRVLVPGMVVMCVASLAVMSLAHRFGRRRTLLLGMAVAAAGDLFMALSSGAGTATWIAVGFCVVALGTGFAETISNDLLVSAVPAERAGAASAVSETSYQVGNVLGTTVAGALLTGAYGALMHAPTGLTAEQATISQGSVAQAMHLSVVMQPDAGNPVARAAHHAFDVSGSLWLAAAAVALLLAATAVGIGLRHGRQLQA